MKRASTYVSQVYKATADYHSGRKLYEHYSAVTDADPPHFLSLRSIVLKRKQPRKLFVQCNTALKGASTENSTHKTQQSVSAW